MMLPKLLANENFPKTSTLYLKEKGFDVVSIGVDFPGISDTEILEMAISESRTILTFDRDYGELIFKRNFRPQFGVIYLRFNNYSPIFPGELIFTLFQREDFHVENTFTVIDENGIRQRVYK
jgi:predicted nuclease of predicted toxin-antitoxin system